MHRTKHLITAFMGIFLGYACLSGFAASEKPAKTFAKRSNPPKTMVRKINAKPETQKQDSNELLVADFESGSLQNSLEGDSGSWNLDPDDPKSAIEIAVVDAADKAHGKVLKIDYDVSSEKNAQNGYWTKLKGLHASGYDHLQFDIRGDAEKGFTDSFKIELKKFKDESGTEKIKGDRKSVV